MLEAVFALPDDEERGYLLLGMARLIKQRGFEHFVAAPLLLPEPEYWPDPVETRGHAAAVLLRRLLSYAGLGDLGVDIEVGAKRPRDVVDEYSEKPDPDADPLHHAAGWFMGIEDEVCHFGVADSALRDEESLIGTLGHEVAHAYRERHGLCVVSRDTEEKLTDLTTIYLGFGFFTLQSSFVFKTGHRDDAGRLLLYERQMLGYLRPGQLALLLAVQLVIRKQGASELRRVLGALAPNHAEALERAYRSLAKQREGLIEQLGLPSDTEWPEPHDLARWTKPLRPATVRVADQAALDREWGEQHEIAFRVRGDLSKHGFALGGFTGFFSHLVEGVGLWMWVLMPVLAVTGYKVGRRLAAARCSSCSHRVTLTEDECSFCDRRLVATIHDVNDRIQAEEDYWEARDSRGNGEPEAR